MPNETRYRWFVGPSGVREVGFRLGKLEWLRGVSAGTETVYFCAPGSLTVDEVRERVAREAEFSTGFARLIKVA